MGVLGVPLYPGGAIRRIYTRSDLRGRPARRFLGEMTTPRRPGESLLQLEHADEPCVFLSLRTRDDR